MTLLSTSHKIALGEGFGVLTRVLYLSPASESGHNTCPSSTSGCRAACLGHSAGKMVFPTHKAARIRKTIMLMNDRPAFMAELRHDIRALIRKAEREGLQPAVRLNGSSDIGWESIAPELFDEFPEIHFYDYTKRFERAKRSIGRANWPANYRLCFSRTGQNDSECREILAMGGTIAAVFANPGAFPETFMGAPVTSGEVHDYRYGDSNGHVIALKARGEAIYDQSGFVIR